MADDVVLKTKKKHVWLRVVLIILLALIIIFSLIYLSLPKIISSTLSGGGVTTFLPEEVKDNVKEIDTIVKDNLGELEKVGISNEKALEIVTNVDYKTFENVIDKMQKSDIKNTNELIDLLSANMDLSSIDVEKIKKEYYSELSESDLEEIYKQFNNPAVRKIGFNVAKNTVLDVLKNQSE